MVLHRLHHDAMLLRGVWDLHPSRTANGWVGHVTITANLVGGVDLQWAMAPCFKHNQLAHVSTTTVTAQSDTYRRGCQAS